MYNQAYAKCPFFRNQLIGQQSDRLNTRTMIRCEGIEGVKAHLTCFSTERKKKEWQAKYCATFDYAICPIAQMITLNKYGEEKNT